MLKDWGQVIIDRKRKINKPSSAQWYLEWDKCLYQIQ